MKIDRQEVNPRDLGQGGAEVLRSGELASCSFQQGNLVRRRPREFHIADQERHSLYPVGDSRQRAPFLRALAQVVHTAGNLPLIEDCLQRFGYLVRQAATFR